MKSASTYEVTTRSVRVFNSIHMNADFPTIIHNECSYLTTEQQSKGLDSLKKNETLFNGTLDNWQTEPIKFN